MSRLTFQLSDDLLLAFDNYLGGMCSGPWEELASALAAVVHEGALSLETAAKINALLHATRGGAE